jgi:hypothetical protein
MSEDRKPTLRDCLAGARAADGLARMEWRNRLAAHGVAAIDPMSAWLLDPVLGALSVRVLAKIALDPSARGVVIKVLTETRPKVPNARVREDIDVVLAELKPSLRSPRPASAAGSPEWRPLRLQFDVALIAELAARYSYRVDPEVERRIADEIGPAAKARGFFTYAEFLFVCHWKTQRTKSRVAANRPADVEEATRMALSTSDESERIEFLRDLDGVDWATASVFLHFGHREPYPIIDFRALEALGIERVGERTVTITFDRWFEYVTYCRDLASRACVSMRILDRALWEWSNERGRPEASR